MDIDREIWVKPQWIDRIIAVEFDGYPRLEIMAFHAVGARTESLAIVHEESLVCRDRQRSNVELLCRNGEIRSEWIADRAGIDSHVGHMIRRRSPVRTVIQLTDICPVTEQIIRGERSRVRAPLAKATIER